MRLNILFFALGAWLLQQQASLPELKWAWGLGAVLALPVLSQFQNTAVSVTREILAKALCLGFGFFWAAAFAHLRLADALPAEWEGRDLQVVGVVASLPQPYERSVRFEFDVEHVLTAGATVPRHVSLS